MIESTLIIPMALPNNASVITFPTDSIRTRSANCCGWLQHQESSPLYKILEGGYYKVNVSATVTSATAGIVAIGLYQDGVLIPETVRAVTLGADEVASVSFTKLEKICCIGNSTLTVQSVPSILTTATGTATATQVPTIIDGIINIIKM